MADALILLGAPAAAVAVLVAVNEWRYGRALRQQRSTLHAIENSLLLLRGALKDEFAERESGNGARNGPPPQPER